MCYSAIWNDRKTLAYHPEILEGGRDLFPEICPDLPEMRGMVAVYEPENMHFLLDSVKNYAVCGIADPYNA